MCKDNDRVSDENYTLEDLGNELAEIPAKGEVLGDATDETNADNN